jgi:hypothetical protein
MIKVWKFSDKLHFNSRETFISGSSNGQGEEDPKQGPDHANASSGFQFVTSGWRFRIHLS